VGWGGGATKPYKNQVIKKQRREERVPTIIIKKGGISVKKSFLLK
jgi:hypothetical protein